VPAYGHEISQISIHPTAISLQPKLTISQPGDSYEQEADRTADRVMRKLAPSKAIQRAPSDEASDPPPAPETPQTQDGSQPGEEGALASEVTPETQSGIDGLRGGGQRLRPDVRGFMESRFGHHFGHVRIHAEGDAARLARSVQARAFTVGSNIAFAAGQYQPDSDTGRQLLAHELTHVVQQTGGSQVADESADPLAQPAVAPTSSPLSIQRQGDDLEEDDDDDDDDREASASDDIEQDVLSDDGSDDGSQPSDSDGADEQNSDAQGDGKGEGIFGVDLNRTDRSDELSDDDKRGDKAKTELVDNKAAAAQQNFEQRVSDIRDDLSQAKDDAAKKAASAKALTLADDLARALTVAKTPNPPAGSPSVADLQDSLSKVASALVSTGLRDDALKVAKKSADPDVQSKIIGMLEPVSANASVSDEQQFLEALAKFVGQPLPPKRPNESDAQWLEARSPQIAQILNKLTKAGMKTAFGKSQGQELGIQLLSSLMNRYFTDDGTDVVPNELGHLTGKDMKGKYLKLDSNSNTQKLRSDCDVLATYAMRMLIPQGWAPVGYMAIIPNDPARSGHVAALVKRNKGQGNEYLGVSNSEFKQLGSFKSDDDAMDPLLAQALTVYGPPRLTYKAYFEPAPTTGAYSKKLLDPAGNNLTPKFKAP
jgi:hypothetical protein